MINNMKNIIKKARDKREVGKLASAYLEKNGGCGVDKPKLNFFVGYVMNQNLSDNIGLNAGIVSYLCNSCGYLEAISLCPSESESPFNKIQDGIIEDVTNFFNQPENRKEYFYSLENLLKEGGYKQ